MRANGRHTGLPPGSFRRIERKIQPGDLKLAAAASSPGSKGAFREHLKKEAAATTDVEDNSLLLGLGQSAFDEPQMVAEHESPVRLFEAVDSGGLRYEPIVRRIVAG